MCIDTSKTGAIQPASIVDTCGALEWLLLATPVVFATLRVSGAAWAAQPECWSFGVLVLVAMLARRERARGVGAARIARERAATKSASASLSSGVAKFFTSTQGGSTDRHRPVKTWVKGASCFLLFLPAVDIYVFQGEEMYAKYGHEVPMLAVQTVFAFMADHVMCGKPSLWHLGDRIMAFTMMTYGTAKPFYYNLPAEDCACSLSAVVAAAVYWLRISRLHHGLPTHHVHHAIFHVVAAAGWNYASLAIANDFFV